MKRDDKIKLLAALSEKDRRAREAPLLQQSIKLTAPQRTATDALQSQQYRIIVLGGGNRMGKSHWLAATTICLAYGYWIFDVPKLNLTPEGDYPDRSTIDPKYWIYRSDGVPFAVPSRILVMSGLPFMRGVGSVLWPKIESLLTPGMRRNPNFLVQRGQYSVPIRIRFPFGTELLFGSGEQATISFEGIDLDAVLNDEPIPRAFWPPLWRGLTDRHGFVIFSMTPVGQNAYWIHDDIICRDDCKFITGSIWSNPNIPEESKRQFLEGLHCSEEELQARETGAFSLQSSRAFPTFDRAIHISSNREPPRGWPRVCICDPAHRRPFFYIWMARGPHGEIEIYDEWPRGVPYMQIRSSNKTIKDYATLIRDSEGRLPADFRVLDPRFGKAEHSVKGYKTTSIQHDFEEYGLYFDCNVPGTEREEIGIQAIRDALSYDKHAPISELNRPRLQVQERCINAIDALEKSTFVPPNARDPTLLDEKTTDHWKDPRDCIRYGILFPVTFGDTDTLSYISEKELLAEDEYSV